ncbi:hypothetical protein WJX75_008737 [Coccomyxa subellipsoidea]|uniref:RNA polymerase sigma-70 domain-containing protein n=1 Tax=Coccomyxa subellipsoidea TaxID=248742 RepID=A0ABR2YEH0_9CHLO
MVGGKRHVEKIGEDAFQRPARSSSAKAANTMGYVITKDLQCDMEAMVEAMVAAQVEAMLATLTARESAILRCHYGLNDGCPLTFEQIGEMFGVSREHIRRIEKRAMLKLRRLNCSSILTALRRNIFLDHFLLNLVAEDL